MAKVYRSFSWNKGGTLTLIQKVPTNLFFFNSFFFFGNNFNTICKDYIIDQIWLHLFRGNILLWDAQNMACCGIFPQYMCLIAGMSVK